MKWSISSNIEAAPNVTVTSYGGKDMEQTKTRGSLKKISGIPRRYSQSIKEEQNCSKTPHHYHTTETCLPTIPDELHPIPTLTTLTESLIPPSMKKKIHNLYPYYPFDHQPLDPSR